MILYSYIHARLASIAMKSEKRSDQELLAMLSGKELDRDEVKKIRLAQQTASVRHDASNDTSRKEMSKLFGCKLLLPSQATSNVSISTQKLLELKEARALELAKERAAAAEASTNGTPTTTDQAADATKSGKKDPSLASMASHRDILKKIKDKDKKKGDANEEPKEATSAKNLESSSDHGL